MAVSFVAFAAAASPQLAAPNEMGVSMGVVQMTTPDVEAAKKFWVTMGGVPGKLGPNTTVVRFPGVVLRLAQGTPSGPSVGSSVNHIAFAVRDVKASMEKWKAAGLKTMPLAIPDQGFLFTPGDLVRVEVLEDQVLPNPIAFHHVHFNVVEKSGEIAAMQAWYSKVFGARPGMRKEFQSGNLPGVNLTYAKAAPDMAALAPTKGRAVDHIGFEVENLEAFCKKAEAGGVKFDVPFAVRPELGISQAFLTDSWGNMIELTEGLFRSSTEVHYYSAKEVYRTFAKDPKATGSSSNGRAGTILNFKDNPAFQVTIRRHDEGNEPEVHEDHWHIFYVLEGDATFVTGGKWVGKVIEGGRTVKLEKGSIIVVPSGIPHWFKDVPHSPWIAFGVEYQD